MTELPRRSPKHESSALPPGYTFTDDIPPRELARHFRRTGLTKTLCGFMLTRLEREHERDGREFITLGVRATNGKLAGSGRILHDGSVGLMCDFGVTPSHRSQGIGKALIVARMGLAESSDIRSLVTDPLMPTNPLSKFYIEQGFEPEPDGRLIYTTDPAAVDAFYEKIRERSA